MVALTRRELMRAAGVGVLGLAAAGLAAPSALAKSSAWRDLDKRLRGRLIRPGNRQYEGLALPRNLRYAALMPHAVALCVDAQDVAAAIAWARRTGTPFAIRGGGHNYVDASSSLGLIISTRAMRRGTVDGSRLHAQAGVLNSDLSTLLTQAGTETHLLPGGTCPNVGIVGVTLGGGIGPNAPWAGLTADHLREVTMVTADGEIVTASARRNPDLFWGLRGAAGGNFGVVTDLKFDMVEVPVTRATTFTLWFAGPEAATQAGAAWQEVRRAGDRQLSGTWTTTMDANGLRARVKGQALMVEEDARALLAPLLALPLVSAEVVERSWWDSYVWCQTPISPSNTFWDRSLFVAQDLPSEVIDRAVGIVARFPSPDSGYGSCGLMGWVGGRVNDVPARATAFVHRDARALMEISTSWPGSGTSASWPSPVPHAIRDWMSELWEAVIPHTTGRSYQNFPDPELSDWARSYYGTNLARLKRVKKVWDPDDVFTYRQGIPLPH
jgi:FAD/FMN-containing dehydrogenase